eukprot:scaffold54340_cov18-Tisochrysis_lutea.AAC.2
MIPPTRTLGVALSALCPSPRCLWRQQQPWRSWYASATVSCLLTEVWDAASMNGVENDPLREQRLFQAGLMKSQFFCTLMHSNFYFCPCFLRLSYISEFEHSSTVLSWLLRWASATTSTFTAGTHVVSWAMCGLQVLLRWACAMISAFAAGTTNARTDVELKEALMTKLKPCPTFRYAPLAAHAQVGRNGNGSKKGKGNASANANGKGEYALGCSRPGE